MQLGRPSLFLPADRTLCQPTLFNAFSPYRSSLPHRSAVLTDEVFQLLCSLFGRNATKISKHNGFVNVQKGIFLANIAIYQQVKLFMDQQIDNGKVDVVTEDTLLHPLLEEVDHLCRVAVLVVLEQFVGLGILLDVFEKLLWVV